MKKRLLKILISVIAVLTVVGIFVACTDNKNNGDDETTEAYVSESTVGDKLISSGASKAMVLSDGWKIKNDPDAEGIDNKWYKKSLYDGKDIDIPGSQYDVTDTCPRAWFSNKFTLDFTPGENDRLLVELGGVCYRCTVWVNGIEIGTHDGSYGTFTFDITDAVKLDGENLLSLYVQSTTDGNTIDGYSNDQLPIWNSYIKIQQNVYVYAKPAVYIEDAEVIPNCENGEIKVIATVNNTSESEQKVSSLLRVREANKNIDLDSTSSEVTVAPGVSTFETTVKVEDFTYWTIDEPFLYNVILNVGSDEYTVKTGYKTLIVNDEGYFELNGERIYIKCSHMCMHVPGSVDVTKDLTYYYNLLIYLKSCGFNTIRFLQSPGFPQLLDMCDEIGLLVYQEHPMSWNKVESDKIDEFFEQSVTEILYRDRNHVSLGMFGMLNETQTNDTQTATVNAARNALKAARDTAPNTLILFSSGRWDGNKSIGSGSNPGSYEWDAYMGDESADASDTYGNFQQTSYWSWMKGMGDVHYYPRLPWDVEDEVIIEQICDTKRAVFFSETGAGSIVNIISDYQTISQNKTSTGCTSYWNIGEHIVAYRSFFDEYGLDNVYSTPENLLIDSEEYQTKQRALILTYIRRCANYNGYSMTMSADCGFRGEGIVNTSGQYKSGVTEMLQASLADLRFCVTLDKYIAYSGEKIPMEIVLSNIDVLTLQNYKIVIRITSDDGLVWKKNVTVRPTKKDDGTFEIIVPVFDDSIDTTGWSTGKYTVGVEMTNGAHPTCGDAEFYIVNKNEMSSIKGTVYTYNVTSAVKSVLTSHGAKVEEYTVGKNVGSSTVYVGKTAISSAAADALYAAAKNGAHVVFLSADAIKSGTSYNVPFEDKGSLDTYDNWLYHFDSVVYGNSVMEDLPNKCILDTDFYSSVYSNYFITGMSVPTDVSVAAVFTGIDGGSSKTFQSGYQLGTYAYGEGYITISTLELIESAGKAATDTILVNLANYSEPSYCKDRVHY